MSILQAAARKKAPAKTRLTRKQAARVLKRSILGPRKSEIDALVGGNYEQWLDQQMQMPVFQPILEIHQTQAPGSTSRRVRLADGSYVDVTAQPSSGSRRDLCLRFVETEHPDVLRHRICNALLELVVCSVVGSDDMDSIVGALTGYYSRLQRSCFTTYKEILRDISLSNEMSIYLTYNANKKANNVTGAQPDENYAREIMQLFSIGLFELNLDGTRRKNGQLDPTDPRFVAGGTDDVPTYGPDDIKAVARIFTGTMIARADVVSPESERYGAGQRFTNIQGGITNGRYPLGALTNIDFFSTDNEIALPKQALPGASPTGFLLNVPGGTGGAVAFDALLDALVNHPSCAPYVSKRLIQLLTCSNPRPAYVARVANVFRNNGMNQVGDMKAVLKAIYLDQDALAPTESMLSIKTRDIDLALRSAVRSQTSPGIIDTATVYGGSGTAPAGKIRSDALEHRAIRRGGGSKYPMQSPSVFGRWPVGFSTRTADAAGLVTPELHTWDEAQIAEQSSQNYKTNLRTLFGLRGGVIATAMLDANVSATFDEFAEVMSGLEIKPAVKTQMLTYIRGVADTTQRFDRMIECLTLTAVSAFQE